MKYAFKDDIICPYCDLVQYIDDCENYDFETICNDCDKIFLIAPYVVTEYSTQGDCDKNKELPHILKRTPTYDSGIAQYRCTKCYRDYYDWELPDGRFPKFSADNFVFAPITEEKPND